MFEKHSRRAVVIVSSFWAALVLTSCLGNPPQELVSNRLKDHPDSGLSGGGGASGAGGAGAGGGGRTQDSGVGAGGGGKTSDLDAAIPDSGDASTCKGGDVCDAGACENGKTVCQSGRPVCRKTENAENGNSCSLGDGGGFCNGGSCASCANGTDCTDPNSCKKKTISCTTGTAVCTDDGTVRDGNACGTDKYCHAGVCAACVNASSCVPADPCHQGKAICTNGALTCADLGTNVAPGSSCGANMVCLGDTCTPCEANLACTPTSSCHKGLTSCASGVSLCVDTGVTQDDGSPCTSSNLCEGNFTCLAGVCVSGKSVACAPPQACYQSGSCDPATGQCAYKPTPAPTPCDDGNACTTGDACDGSGKCVPSGQTACAKQTAGSCFFNAVCDPVQGCVAQPKPINTACGAQNSGMICVDANGTCACPSGLKTCSNVCVNEQTDSSNCGACGSACAAPKTCSNSSCSCPPQKSTYCAGSNSCVDMTSDPKNCGACGHDCQGGTCLGSFCQALTIGSIPANVGYGTSVTASATDVYFGDGPGGHVYTCQVSGCPFDATNPNAPPPLYVSGLGFTWAVLYDPSTKLVYASDDNNGKVFLGTSAVTGTDGSTEGIATDSKYLYWGDYDGIGRVDKANGGAQFRVWSGAPSPVKGVTVDSSGNLWAVTSNATGEIVSCAPGGGCVPNPTTPWVAPNANAIRMVNGFPTIATNSGILQCAKPTACDTLNTVWTGYYQSDFIADSKYLYFSTGNNISKCAVAQVPCTTVIPVTNGAGANAVSFALNGTWLYWITGSGVVQRVTTL